jgi:hypothetical protein
MTLQRKARFRVNFCDGVVIYDGAIQGARHL